MVNVCGIFRQQWTIKGGYSAATRGYTTTERHQAMPPMVNTHHLHLLKSLEFWCGDGIYHSSCYGVLTRHQHSPGLRCTWVRMSTITGSELDMWCTLLHTTKGHAMWSGKKNQGAVHMRCCIGICDSPCISRTSKSSMGGQAKHT